MMPNTGGQPVGASPLRMTRYVKLERRCKKLADYCKDLLQTNKVLDVENRLAIAQLIHMTDEQQLSNLSSAINFVAGSGVAYWGKKLMPLKHQRQAATL